MQHCQQWKKRGKKWFQEFFNAHRSLFDCTCNTGAKILNSSRNGLPKPLPWSQCNVNVLLPNTLSNNVGKKQKIKTKSIFSNYRYTWNGIEWSWWLNTLISTLFVFLNISILWGKLTLTWMFHNDDGPCFPLGNQKQPYPSNRVNGDPHYTDEYPSPTFSNRTEYGTSSTETNDKTEKMKKIETKRNKKNNITFISYFFPFICLQFHFKIKFVFNAFNSDESF